MKLLSWNVNGLRSTARNGFLAWLEDERPDVVCLQETRVLPEELPAELRNPLGYHACWHPARKKGYSGVATFSKRRPLAVRLGIGNRAIDREGRVLATEFPRFVRNTERTTDHAAPRLKSPKGSFSGRTSSCQPGLSEGQRCPYQITAFVHFVKL